MHPPRLRPARLLILPLTLAALVSAGCGRAPSAVPATGPSGSAPAANPTPTAGPPREVVAAQFDRILPGFEGAGASPEAILGYEAFPFGATGIYEVRVKVRLRMRGDTFQEVRPGAEFVRAGLLEPARAEAWSVSQSADYDPRLEETTKDAVFLEPVRRAGEALEVYGTMEAQSFVDRWEFSPFAARNLDPSALGRPRGDFPPAALVRGSPEAERLLAAARATRQERLARLKQLEERARALVAPGRRYAGQLEHPSHYSRPAEPAEAVFEPPAARDPTDPLPAGSFAVAVTITAPWPGRRNQTAATPLRWGGQVDWRGRSYRTALMASSLLEFGPFGKDGRVGSYTIRGGLSPDGQLTLDIPSATLRLRPADPAAPAPR